MKQPARQVSCHSVSSQRQRGVVLFIALIVLVAMTLAGIGMVRSVDTGNVIAGNLAFKQATLNASDRGIEAGYQWLLANSGGTTLDASAAANGYYATPAANDAQIDWDDINSWGGAVTIPVDAAGNTTRYIIHRLCPAAGAVSGQTCAISTGTNGSNSAVLAEGSSQSTGAVVFTQTSMVYYRITARVDGPRDTTSISQSYVLIAI